MKFFKKRRYYKHCNHFEQRCIYGDEINHVGGFRAQCLRCGTFLWELPTLLVAADYKKDIRFFETIKNDNRNVEPTPKIVKTAPSPETPTQDAEKLVSIFIQNQMRIMLNNEIARAEAVMENDRNKTKEQK